MVVLYGGAWIFSPSRGLQGTRSGQAADWAGRSGCTMQSLRAGGLWGLQWLLQASKGVQDGAFCLVSRHGSGGAGRTRWRRVVVSGGWNARRRCSSCRAEARASTHDWRPFGLSTALLSASMAIHSIASASSLPASPATARVWAQAARIEGQPVAAPVRGPRWLWAPGACLKRPCRAEMRLVATAPVPCPW